MSFNDCKKHVANCKEHFAFTLTSQPEQFSLTFQFVGLYYERMKLSYLCTAEYLLLPGGG